MGISNCTKASFLFLTKHNLSYYSKVSRANPSQDDAKIPAQAHIEDTLGYAHNVNFDGQLLVYPKADDGPLANGTLCFMHLYYHNMIS